MSQQRNASQTLRRLLAFMTGAVVLCAVVGTALGYYFAQLAGVWSGICAAVLGLLMIAVTAFTHHNCLRYKDYLMAWMGLDFFVKFVLLLASLLAVKKFSNWDPKTLGLTLIAMLILTSIGGMYAVMTAHTALLDEDEQGTSK